MRDLAVAMKPMWTLEEAIDLAKKVEAICPSFGYHVALTGGLLYKEGPRKDCDLVFYQTGSWLDQTGSWLEVHDYGRLLDKLAEAGIIFTKPHEYKQRYVYKASYLGKSVDILFPEFNGQYEE